MIDIESQLKHRARRLHRDAAQGDPGALERLRRAPELSRLEAATVPSVVKRRHCLAVIAQELGFRGWSHLTAVLRGKDDGDFGTLLHRGECFAHWNIWSAHYDEAKFIRADHGGYLLPYRHQFVIVDRHYVETLGLDPDDDDWDAIGRDWVRPADPQARRRLVDKAIVARL